MNILSCSFQQEMLQLLRFFKFLSGFSKYVTAINITKEFLYAFSYWTVTSLENTYIASLK